MKITVGDTAPDFKLPSTAGSEFHLRENLGDGKLVLYFYPKDFTTGCTAEACGFRDEFLELRRSDMKVIGISTDTIDSHLKFQKAYSLPFDLLADTNREVARMYGAYNKLFRMTNRVTFVIDSNGTILSVTKNLFSPGRHISAAKAQSGQTNQ